ncbi:hypothetical protein PVAND_006598 [Polypedilum vanderplanki]|uniref:Transmembrane protein 70 n=1 Tax=Polypedilum vanderplanki TaxID=319348 RepID=A0A9J6C5D9_POLVA|nr:hypothetical protein PVAND_006598 [Polypedilum vanderplanki]
MLLARSFNCFLFKNTILATSQHVKDINTVNINRAFHVSRILSVDKKNQFIENSQDDKRVYYGTLTPQIRAVKVFSLTTSLIGVIAQPFLYEQASKLGTSTPVILGICGFIGFFTFITPFLIHIIASKYVTELHYNSNTNEYCATTISFFMTKKKIKFRKENVTVPEVPGMFTSFLVRPEGSTKQYPLFVDPRLFDDVSHYIKLMNYDKPIDFKLNLTEEESERLKKK